ncbi:MAG: aa3-type cytochrome c oxidase subunit IV [Pseudomonadota bacterium]
MSDHQLGEMDVEVQEKTFEGFVKFVSYSVVAIILLLIFIGLVNG